MTIDRSKFIGSAVFIRPGYGFWRTDSYPIGGCFDRAGENGLIVVGLLRTFPDYKGCTAEGQCEDGRKVAFNLRDTQPHIRPQTQAEIEAANPDY